MSSASPATRCGRPRRGRSRRCRRSSRAATRRSRRSSPDLILAFSDLQADIADELVQARLPVFTFNQRSVAEILQMIRMLGGIVGARQSATARRSCKAGSTRSAPACQLPRRPRVFFEEWDDPLIGGIQWAEELDRDRRRRADLSRARRAQLAKDRIVTGEQVIARAPEIIIGSWCGKPVRPKRITARPGWDQIPAVRDGQIYEVKSTYILQPGPAALTEGVTQIAAIRRSVGQVRRVMVAESSTTRATPRTRRECASGRIPVARPSVISRCNASRHADRNRASAR